jgi:hypothetical protein
VTVPVALLGDTLAVNTMVWPAIDGLADEPSVVAVAAFDTVWTNDGEVLGASFVSPV